MLVSLCGMAQAALLLPLTLCLCCDVKHSDGAAHPHSRQARRHYACRRRRSLSRHALGHATSNACTRRHFPIRHLQHQRTNAPFAARHRSLGSSAAVSLGRGCCWCGASRRVPVLARSISVVAAPPLHHVHFECMEILLGCPPTASPRCHPPRIASYSYALCTTPPPPPPFRRVIAILPSFFPLPWRFLWRRGVVACFAFVPTSGNLWKASCSSYHRSHAD